MGMTNYWRTIDTKVSHLLTGDNYEVKHLIRYESVELAPVVRQDNEARIARDL